MAAKKKTVMRGRRPSKAQASPRPVYFLALSVENVRCFGPRQTLDLSDGEGRPARWTVILGNNGVGKTTLLQCLTIFEPAPTGLYFFPRIAWEPRPPSFPRERLGKRALITGWVLLGGALHSDGGSRHELDIEWQVQEPQHWEATGSLALDVPLGGLVCYGYGATRRMGQGALSKEKPSRPNDSLFHEDVPLRNAEEWLLQSDYASSKHSPVQARARARRDRVIQVLKDLLPDIDGIRFVPPTSESSAAQVEFKTPYGWVGMQHLSVGYRTLIAWMVDLASRLFERYPDSPNPLAEPAIVLVDEIDLHLHPTWQRRLIGYLNEHFPNAQFIVTAHSPLVVQSAADANIVVLRQEGDHVVIDNDVASIRGWRVDQILTSDLFGLQSARPPQLDSLLAERTALLSKARLTPKDKARLAELEKEMGPLPAGETQTQMEALDIIQRFAARVGKGSK